MIGEQTAKRIIQYRTMVGPIESAETLAIASGFTVETVQNSVLPYVSLTTERPKGFGWQNSNSSPPTSPRATSPER
ncbi:MAG: hypothetical protein U5N86_01425 [Planctomycetota bacterium]|nr:hypothetical protein [Planctomycetota bacterium]